MRVLLPCENDQGIAYVHEYLTHFGSRNMAHGLHSWKGILFAVGAACITSLIALIVKFATPFVNVIMLVWARQMIAFLFVLPLVLREYQKHGRHGLHLHRPWLLLLRTVTSLLTAYCTFYAISQLALAEAMTLSYTRSLFIPLLAWLILRNRIEGSVWLCLLLGFVGVLLILQPGFHSLNIATLAGLTSGLLGGITFLSLRWLNRTEGSNQITFYYFLASSLLASIPLIWFWELPSKEAVGWILLLGFASAINQLFLTRAYRYARSSIVGGILYLVLVFAFFYQWIFFGHHPQLMEIFGIVLICTSALVSSIVTTVQAKQPADG